MLVTIKLNCHFSILLQMNDKKGTDTTKASLLNSESQDAIANLWQKEKTKSKFTYNHLYFLTIINNHQYQSESLNQWLVFNQFAKFILWKRFTCTLRTYPPRIQTIPEMGPTADMCDPQSRCTGSQFNQD
eukprot:TRINITY_DN94087_c0_g1_i1.p1 TRINITY_DN94087_c0_g1~~TRINITY_DN94087_c0_g1_i1.p1  ORF type:complete len:130 (-),score=4.28 TRINITY_DN94087_c0_g1_i1:871-1260(-)